MRRFRRYWSALGVCRCSSSASRAVKQYSAMIFAILGLRTLYFVLEALKDYLAYLEKVVIALLFFIAAKLALNASAHIFHHGFEI